MAGDPAKPLDRPTPAAKTAELDLPLHALGFEYGHVSPEKITGHLIVSESWCQPFKRMHGGVAAFVAEGVASTGAYMASGFQRVAGIQLSINFIKPAFLGDKVEVEASRILLSKTIQLPNFSFQNFNLLPGHSSSPKSREDLLPDEVSPAEISGFQAPMGEGQC
ncbi:hypothetical protein M5K25_001496 [Dendrobium thyrsiflorum]|uniref:Thioesterase domain-containing protein n=1 Tax=Dendrobium thyrsiflorum TaxID=117978 RepID=A0ABD0VRZ5_DENTH